MTSRERVLAVLRGNRADRVPWIPLCYRDFFLALPDYRERFPLKWNEGLPEDRLVEELTYRLEFYRRIDADFMSWSGHCPSCVTMPVENRTVKTIQENDRVTIRQETPVGALEARFKFSVQSQTLQQYEYPVKTDQDYAVLKYILEHTRIEPAYALASQFVDTIADGGVALAYGPHTPMSRLKNEYLGPEKMLTDVYEPSDLRDEIIDVQNKVQLDVCRAFAGSPYTIFLGWSTVDIGLISPRIYNQYYVPYYNQYNEILHGGGKICLDHLSGQKIGTFIDGLEQTTFDGFCGLVFPPKDGDIKLSDLAKRWHEKKIVPLGGLSPHFLATATATSVADLVKTILDEVGDHPFILSTADDTVPGTPIKNLEVVAETIRRHSR